MDTKTTYHQKGAKSCCSTAGFLGCRFVFVFFLFFSVFSGLAIPLHAEYSAPERIGDPALQTSMEAMRAHQIQYQMYLFYTINIDTPGFVETGGYNVRKPDGEILMVPFYRWRAGPVIETNSDMDVYLDANSRGLFAVQLPSTIAYTRNGRMRIDTSRRLVSHQGSYPFVNALGGGPIIIPEGADMTISASGMVYADSDPVGKLKALVFSNEGLSQLVTLNGVFFVSADKGREPEVLAGGQRNYRVRQGFIEDNNVLKAIVGDVGMLKRSYNATAKAAKVMTRVMGTSVQMIGN